MQNLLKKYGIKMPEILLPSDEVDLSKWSVIACDQYTSQPDYWNRVKDEVGTSPSTLNLTFPEIYLKEPDKEERINRINKTMEEYMADGTLKPCKPCFVLVDRSTPNAVSRKGLILAVDLECYDYTKGSTTLIRATEGTILDRIPPRVKIRENAPIELPHIMLLIDDPDKTLIEKLYDRTDRCEKLYDFELMQGGGRIKGWRIDDAESISIIENALERLTDPRTLNEKYASTTPFLFAAGDGNHSLASAKAHWENVKASLGSPAEIEDHPARFALVEVVNVHDDGLVFEPIHRVLFGVDTSSVLENIRAIYSSSASDHSHIAYSVYSSKEAMENACHAIAEAAAGNENTCSCGLCSCEPTRLHMLPFILEGNYGLITVSNPDTSLEAGTLQGIIDKLIKENSNLEVDYIHGEKAVTEMGSRKGTMGFYLPAMNKHDLFRTVISDGVLPRKTFSMGEAEEKRYYLECRRIK